MKTKKAKTKATKKKVSTRNRKATEIQVRRVTNGYLVTLEFATAPYTNEIIALTTEALGEIVANVSMDDSSKGAW